MSAPPCVSLRAMKNGRPRPTHSHRAAIYANADKQFSRPMTGHTPQKLPRFRAISCIIAVRAIHSSWKIRRFPLHALEYNTTPFIKCQGFFQKKSQKFHIFFVDYAENLCTMRGLLCVRRVHFRLFPAHNDSPIFSERHFCPKCPPPHVRPPRKNDIPHSGNSLF